MWGRFRRKRTGRIENVRRRFGRLRTKRGQKAYGNAVGMGIGILILILLISLLFWQLRRRARETAPTTPAPEEGVEAAAPEEEGAPPGPPSAEDSTEKEVTMDRAVPQSNLVKLSDTDFRLEEPWQDIRELDVYDINGEQIGSVEDLYVEREARLPRFLDIAAGGFLGLGKKHFLVPVEEVSRDVGEDRVTITVPKDKVLNSPEFNPDVGVPT